VPEDDLLVDPTWGLVPVQVYINEVIADSPAEAASLVSGDRLFAVDGQAVRSWAEITWLVGTTVEGLAEDEPPRSLDLTVVRNGERLIRSFTPMVQREVVRGEPRFRPIIGVYRYGVSFVAGGQQVHYYGTFEAIPLAVGYTGQAIRKIFRVLGHLAVGGLAPKESVGGPVAIVQMAAQSVRLGFWTWAQTLAMISVSLGIVNLLPVPVLDGGHILFYTIELLRGRPLPLVLRERVQMIGVLMLAAVMLMVFVIDISRLFEQGVGG
jgi:regulator of sigma E protease